MQYTCNSCNLVFPTPEDQRVHMKSDWHRYNLKRRVAQLPSIDEDLFNSKVASLAISETGSDNINESKIKGEGQLTKKEIRRREKEALHEKKKQILETARQSMLSKMRDQNEENNGTTSSAFQDETALENIEDEKDSTKTEGDLTSEQQEELIVKEKLSNKVDIPITTCLFCHTKQKANFEDLESNLAHMLKNHGLFIPEKKYLVDIEGLIGYLGEKIGLGNVCLCCSYQGKNIEAVREHMLNKRHMRLPYETEDEKLEVSEFYDFSSTYDDNTIEDGKAENEEDWEDVSGDEVEDDEINDLPPTNDSAIYQNGNELILPSGAVVGHRSLARYYRQNFAPERILSEGQGTVIAAETRHMLTIKDREALSTQKRAWGRQKKREDVNDRRAAKFINNQPHYRDQLLQ